MTRWMTCALTAAIASLATPAARADVSWDFIVTDATDLRCQPSCPPMPPLPAVGGGLTISDAAFFRGGVSYAYFPNFGSDTMEASGDTDFALSLGIFPLPLDTHAFLAASGEFIGEITLVVAKDGSLSGNIFINTSTDTIRDMEITDGVVTNAFWASDERVPACGDNIACELDGYWQLTSALPIPEPPAAGIFLGAIAVLGLLVWNCRPANETPT